MTELKHLEVDRDNEIAKMIDTIKHLKQEIRRAKNRDEDSIMREKQAHVREKDQEEREQQNLKLIKDL